jgi:YHS domain-containing protein
MQVRTSDAPAKTELDGTVYYFCMQGCKDSFLKEPAKYL